MEAFNSVGTLAAYRLVTHSPRLNRTNCAMDSLNRIVFTTLVVLSLLGIVWSPAAAQESPTEGTAAKEIETVKPVPALSSPQATLRTFLRTMQEGNTEEAIACLDLSYLTNDVRNASGPNIAHQLRIALNHVVGISLDDEEHVWEQLPDDNEYEQPFHLGEIEGSRGAADELVLARGEDGNWRFTEETCRTVEQAIDELEQLPTLVQAGEEADSEIEIPFPLRLRQWFPPSLRQPHFILPDYQWICLIAVIFLGLVADVITRSILTWIADRWFAKNVDDEEESETTAKVWRPLGRLANAAVWYFGTKLIGLPSEVLNVLLVILKLFTILAAVWSGFAIVDLAGGYWTRRSKTTATRFDDLMVPLVSKTLKLTVGCIGLLTVAQTFDLPIMGLLGGLGIGGAALALASKDAVANFFGSVTVLFDRPFEVGDWIITDGAEGTVEAVGFRTHANSDLLQFVNHATQQPAHDLDRRQHGPPSLPTHQNNLGRAVRYHA